ncbi:MAG: hypothetical protein BA865_09150 [Desulfobacterales bacterium S5133MH4]|nr:MAG: hypothetical protein BA865_09150 [Desulfobacterales bacterium S5133MH4]
MNYNLLFAAVIAIATALGTAGCTTTLSPGYPATSLGQATPVMTEYSQGLACLGELIDQTDKPRLTVYVDKIRDQTVPRRYENRRLSHGAQWWIHTAISKLGTNRIQSTTDNVKNTNRKSNHLVLSGAWTQDDLNVKRNGGGVNVQLGDIRFGIGSDRRFDVIAGDFVSVANGRVLYASAISLAIGRNNTEVLLRVEDSDDVFELDLSNTLNEGPQFAQRRITEAAVMIHLSRYFEINCRSCIEAGWANPQEFRKKLEEYKSLQSGGQVKAMQLALKKAGYDPGPVDGKWAERSSRALMRFQTDAGYPVNGRPSAVVYAMLSLRSIKSENPGRHLKQSNHD